MDNRAVRRLLFLSLALGLSSALAVRLPAPEGCPTPPAQIADVLVGGDFRGNQPIYQTDGQLWIPERVLGLGEDSYTLERLNCDGEIYARLNPALKTAFDPETVSLDITPNLDLLRSSTLDLDGPSLASPSDSPLLRLGYGASTSARLASGGLQVPRVGVGLDAQLYFQGFTVQATGQGNFQGDKLSSNLDFRATYPITPNLRSSLYWRNVGEIREQIGGVLEGQWVDSRLPDQTIDLPLEAQVLVQGLGPSQSFRAAAGRLTLRNLRVGVLGGAVSIRVTDALGTRNYESRRTFRAGLLWPGGVTYRLEGGIDSGHAFGTFSTLYGLSENMSLRGNVSYTQSQGGNLSLTALSYLGDTPFSIFGQVGITPEGTYLPSVGASTGVRLGPLDLGVSSTVTLYDLLSSSAALSVSAGNGSFGVQTSLSFDLKQRLSASINANLRPSRDLSVSPFVRYQNNVLSFGVSGSYSIENHMLSAQVQNGSSPQVTYSTQLSPNLSAGAQLNGSVLGVGLRYSDVIDAGVAATTQGDLSADISGALIVSSEGVFVARAGAGGILIVQTGVPNIPLYANGEYKGRTDARGELAITGVSEASNVQVSVRSGQLPINISVAQEMRDVYVPGERVNRLDWTENFQVLSFVKFLFDDLTPAVNGSVRIGASEYFLDEQGVLLMDRSFFGLVGALFSEDRSRSCAVILIQVHDQVMCRP